MRSLNWAEMLLPASAALASVTAAYPWVILLSGDRRPLPLALCYATTVLALLMAKLPIHARWPWRRRLLLVVSGMAFSIIAVWLIDHRSPSGPDWWSSYWLGWIGLSPTGEISLQTDTAIFTALYWYTLGLARPGWGEEDARQLLTRGLVALMLFLLAARFVGLAVSGGAGQIVMPYAVLFLGSVLMTLAMARARAVRLRGRQKGVEQRTIAYSWLPLGMLLALFVILTNTSLVPRILEMILSAFWSLARLAVLVVALPVGYLADWLVTIARRLMAGRPLEQQPQAFRSGDGLQELQEKLQAQAYSTPTWMSVVLIVGVVLILMIIVVRRLSLGSLRDDTTVDEERESIKPKASPMTLLRKLVRRRVRRPVLGRNWAMCSIDELYRCLLQLGEQRGRARLEHETPHEYQRVLLNRCPDKVQVIEAVTDAFDRSRFGRETISEEEIKQLVAMGVRSPVSHEDISIQAGGET